jgi:hypothetical protein
MDGKGTAPKENPSGWKRSLLPGILAAVAMLGCSLIQVIGMLAYNWSGGTTVLMLAIGALVYFGTMGYQQWRASSG